MNTNNSPLMWSFSLGTVFATQIKISYFLGLLFIALMFQLGIELGMVVSMIMFFSILAHELFGHVLISRMTGGSGDEILMWPFGGLAFCRPNNTFSSRFLTSFGGPLVHLIICMLVFPALAFTSYAAVIFNPLHLPIASLSENRLQEILVLTFHVNWVLLLINLIPLYPMDGGKMLEAVMQRNSDMFTVKTAIVNLGFIISVIMMFSAIILQSMPLVLIASLILVMNNTEMVMMQAGSLLHFQENEFGYDFSEGYTSLEKSAHTQEKKQGFWERWKEKSQKAKEQKEQDERFNLEKTLDDLLAKVSTGGMASLTAQEQKQLQRASQLLRDRSKTS